jgi:hypothetical protein
MGAGRATRTSEAAVRLLRLLHVLLCLPVCRPALLARYVEMPHSPSYPMAGRGSVTAPFGSDIHGLSISLFCVNPLMPWLTLMVSTLPPGTCSTTRQAAPPLG